MRENVSGYLEKLKKNKRAQRRKQIMLMMCGILITAGVIGGLVLPGLGQEGEPNCGFTEHVHDDTCGIKYDCDIEAHEHTEECVPVYECEHIHTEECVPIYTCGLEHEHTEECGVTYACEHVHTEECVPVYECVEHIHTEECGVTYACGLEAHTHTDACYVSVMSEDEDVNQRLVVTMTPRNGTVETNEGLAGQTLSAKVVSTYSKANDTGKDVTVAIKVSDRPQGVKIAGFNSKGEMLVDLKDENDELLWEITVELIEDEKEGTYIRFTQPQGSTLEFDIQFNSENGIMAAESSVQLSIDKNNIKGLDSEVGVTDSFTESLTLKWTAKNEWYKVDKKVNNADNNEIAVTADGKLSGKLTYTITANSSNNESTGEIRTDHIIVEDTLTLPTNIALPVGAMVDTDKMAVVTSDGTTILSFTELQGRLSEN